MSNPTDPTKLAQQIMNDHVKNIFAKPNATPPAASVMSPPAKGVPPPRSPVSAKQHLSSLLASQSAPTPTPTTDPGFQAYVKQYGKNWDPVDAQGLSGGYRLKRAYQLGIKPDAAGHLPDYGPNKEPLKTYMDPNRVTNGIDNGTGYQVAPPTYTGPLTQAVIKNAPHYYRAGTAKRPGGPGGWDDIPAGTSAPALTPPVTYLIPPDPALDYIKKHGH